MAKLPTGQFTKKNISKEWPKNIVGDHIFPNTKSYNFRRSVNIKWDDI